MIRAHGLRGTVRVRPLSGDAGDTADTIAEVEEVWLDDVRYTVRRVQPERDDVLVDLDGVTDRNQSEALRGRALSCERGALPPAPEGEVYVADLIGCEVVSPEGASIGRVRGSFHAGAHETLIVDGARGEVLLPWAPGMVVSTDVEAKQIVYAAPPGLLDLDEAEEA